LPRQLTMPMPVTTTRRLAPSAIMESCVLEEDDDTVNVLREVVRRDSNKRE
jgi:hypothetical protein